MTLRCGADPVRFPGDMPTSAQLTAGEIVDLNVMTRRDRFEHRLSRIAQPAHCDFGDDDIALVLSFDGATTVELGRDIIELRHADAVLLPRTAAAGFRIVPSAKRCYLVRLRQRR